MRFDGEYELIECENNQWIRGYVLGRSRSGKHIVLNDSAEMIEVALVNGKRGLMYSAKPIKVSKAIRAKVDVFGKVYSRWNYSWMEDPRKNERIVRDWRLAIAEDQCINDGRGLEIAKTCWEGVHGYEPCLVEDAERQVYRIHLEREIPMSEEMVRLVYKTQVLGIESIREAPDYDRILNRLFCGAGYYNSKVKNKYPVTILEDAKEKVVVHLVSHGDEIAPTIGSIKAAIENFKRDLHWVSPRIIE